MKKENKVSYLCVDSSEWVAVQKEFYALGYTFNGTKSENILKFDNDNYNIFIHVKHDEKDMGYDYYRKDDINKYEHIVSRCETLIHYKMFIRENKLKRILK